MPGTNAKLLASLDQLAEYKGKIISVKQRDGKQIHIGKLTEVHVDVEMINLQVQHKEDGGSVLNVDLGFSYGGIKDIECGRERIWDIDEKVCQEYRKYR